MSNQSKPVVKFIGKILLTDKFWFLFLASFTCVLMMAWRGVLRDEIFKLAQKTARRG